jgi:predicted enzyme related to lactoylglutathione lyase
MCLDGRKNDAMDVDVLFAGVAVSDFDAALAWYERFFDRRPDIVAHETEVMWQITERGWLYVLRDVGHAGSSIVTLAVPDIEAATSALAERGVKVGPIAPEGDAGRKAIARDADGNTVAIIEVRHP